MDATREAREDVEQLNAHDAAFHRAVISATGNETLLTLLESISGRTLAEHEAIFNALSRRSPVENDVDDGRGDQETDSESAGAAPA
ncbi:hypothetical protein GCM10022403_086000 [Streptomyces coacervatus]|uniref:GntR C-terminal domain-containing protein n=1 Tax=Streptomyces coacervatus TaxID=647381 RepID=A0ABP7JCU1_9ACTN